VFFFLGGGFFLVFFVGLISCARENPTLRFFHVFFRAGFPTELVFLQRAQTIFSVCKFSTRSLFPPVTAFNGPSCSVAHLIIFPPRFGYLFLNRVRFFISQSGSLPVLMGFGFQSFCFS